MTDKLTSILINRQLPEFIREEYPKFILFLEAYYEFLEKEQYTLGVSQKNDLIDKAKDLRFVSDVDLSLDQFEEHFFNMFLPYMPKETAANKDFVIKNIMPLYLSKGSEKSYKLLFRLLFDDEINVTYPRDQILRASDGRWVKQRVLRITEIVYSHYDGDGSQKTFYLPYSAEPGDISVYIDDVLTTNYLYYKEYRKLIFTTAPVADSIIKIYFNNFDPSILVNRRVEGAQEGAYAIVEKVNRKVVGDTTYLEFFLDEKTIYGNFIIGELINTDVIISGQTIPIVLQSFSSLERITITNPGAGYNIGDPVLIRGTAIRDGYAIIDDVVVGVIDDVDIISPGIGFKVGNNVSAVGYDSNTFLANVSLVNTGVDNSLTSLTYNTDLISDYASKLISDADYGFPGALTENVNTVIAQALSNTTITGLGDIAGLSIVYSLISSLTPVQFEVDSPALLPSIRLKDLGVIGQIRIDNPGENYSVGDNLVFTWTTSNISGHGVAAKVATVDANGAIETILITSGGIGYRQGVFPEISVENISSGTNANLSVASILGDGEILQAETANGIPGQILSIRIIDSGASYANVPGIDLSGFGDGTATATATLANSFLTLPGRWTTSDSLLSFEDVKLQGRDYYIDFSYLIESEVEFSKYKNLLKNLLHPSGLVNYAKYRLTGDLLLQTTTNVTSELFVINNLISVDSLSILSDNTEITADETVF
jgi:hypothetical protein